jgi:hypothetical protein
MNTGKGDLSAGRGDYNQISAQANQLFALMYPMLAQLVPELQNTANGQYTPLTASAQAPVIAQTNSGINTADNQVGGSGNPTAARYSAAQTGQQTAGLASSSLMQSVIQAMSNLGIGGVNSAQAGLGTAAQGLTGIGSAESQGFSSALSSFLGPLGKIIAPGTNVTSSPNTGDGGAGTLMPTSTYSDPSQGWGITGAGTGGVGAAGGAVTPAGVSAPISSLPPAGAGLGF